MGPAIALRLRQHLTLTPQVQQALKLLQMSALEFAQEMEEALTANPFLEENPDAPPPRDARRSHDRTMSSCRRNRSSRAAPVERDQEDWGGRERRAAHAAAAPARAADDLADGRARPRARPHDRSTASTTTATSRSSFDELAALVPPEHDVQRRGFRRRAAGWCRASTRPASPRARSRSACCLQLAGAARGHAGARARRSTIVQGHLQPARQPRVGAAAARRRLRRGRRCTRRARSSARSIRKPGHRFGPQEARYVVPDVMVQEGARPLGGDHQSRRRCRACA